MGERRMIDINSTVFDEMRIAEENNKSASEKSEIKNQQQRRRRCLRHTPHQIQKLQEFFKDCPLPDKKQRSELGAELGLDPLKVKFWFQNKRTHLKATDERRENKHLWAENERLGVENMQYKEALMNACCPSCGCMLAIVRASVDDHLLRMENARLRAEIGRVSTIAAKFVGKAVTDPIEAPCSSTLCSD